MLRRKRHPQREHDQGDGDQAVGELLEGQQLLDRDQAGDGEHPRQAHHSEGEQRGHQPPAAADAPRAVRDTQAQRSRGPVTPVGEHEVKR